MGQQKPGGGTKKTETRVTDWQSFGAGGATSSQKKTNQSQNYSSYSYATTTASEMTGYTADRIT